MERAKLLLSDTSVKIGEIAELLGYEDSFYFSNVFKKHTGLSPRSYRTKYSQ
ncbi:MAG: AraC family transcriptional regulator [Clostridiales bacterium]|nr:AraC family transcriptional regulator [Clostridiales bacterium]